MKSDFVTQVSHELRTPLLAIRESLALILGGMAGEVTSDQQKFLSIAQRNITRLSRLINDLLDVAKLEAGKLMLRPIPFEMGAMVHHVVETVRSLADAKRITIEERYLAKEINVIADPDRIIQVMTNLLSNAVKFTPEDGKIFLEVDSNPAVPGFSSEPCVTVSVRDTGPGVPLEEQEYIFGKFEQASTPHQEVNSTGLGLTIAKEIVELHRGKIWVESQEGEGSRFVFVIPRQFSNGNGNGTARIQN